jgi:hypothetical protein
MVGKPNQSDWLDLAASYVYDLLIHDKDVCDVVGKTPASF